MNPVTDVLRAARDLLSEPGAWCKGTVVQPNPHGGFSRCAIGALVSANALAGSAAVDAAIKLLATSLPNPTLGIAEFNDAPERTLDEVLDAFAKAIKHSEDPAS